VQLVIYSFLKPVFNEYQRGNCLRCLLNQPGKNGLVFGLFREKHYVNPLVLFSENDALIYVRIPRTAITFVPDDADSC